LVIVILNGGLEEIRERDFFLNSSLQRIVTPHAVKRIKNRAYYCSTGLTHSAMAWAFNACRSLERIVIPPAVEVIEERAFTGCSE
jgi:hypothetical protein